jgi:hypothetical protein
MRTLTIGFSKSKKPFAFGSWLIRKYQKTPYSHVYVKFRSESLNRVLIYEAVGSGLRFIGSNVWNSHATEMFSFDIEVTEASYIGLLQYCVDNAGTDYGFLQNIGVVLSNAFGLLRNPFSKGKNCSEAVSDMLRMEGYEFNKESNLLTPKDVYNALLGHIKR